MGYEFVRRMCWDEIVWSGMGGMGLLLWDADSDWA